MKINWQNLYILWSFLSLDLLGGAGDTHESSFTRRKQSFKSKLIKPSTTGGSKSSRSLLRSAFSLSQPTSQRTYSLPSFQTSRSAHPGKPEANIQSDLPDVSVTCSVSDFVVRVKPAFYGLGADAKKLTLGSSCKSNGVLRPYGDLLFSYPLTACDAVRKTPKGYLVYKFVLHYKPFPRRAHGIDVDIECRYQRVHHVYQLAVKPTWETVLLRKTLKGRSSDFQINLMDDSWSKPAKFKVFHLGKMMNFQVSAPHLPFGKKLYISSCYAAPSSGANSFLKYTIIDNLGCMMDSRSDPGASQFISRTHNTLRFSVKAFQFTADPDTEISVHCKLVVTSEEPDPAHKSCTYKWKRWRALDGDDSICECCDFQCLASKRRRAVFEGSTSSGSLLVSDQVYTADVSTSMEDETRINHRIDGLLSHESLWESTDVAKHDGGEERGYMEESLDGDEESRLTLGDITDDLDEFDFRDDVLEKEWEPIGIGTNEFGEDAPVNELEDFLEDEEQESRSEGREAEQKNSDVVRNWVQLEQLKAGIQGELQPHYSREQEENSKYTDRSEEDDRRTVSGVEWKSDLADEGEMTWYFTWR